MKEIKIFKIKIHPFYKEEFIDIIESNLKHGRRTIQNGINAASINELIKNEELVEAYNNSDLMNIDGMSVVWALRFLGYSIPQRVACPDLANDILAMAERNNFSVFLFGTKETNLLLSIENLISNFPRLKIAGYRNGYYQKEDEDSIIKLINDATPDILFLGLPSPQKELFIERNRNQLQVKYSLGVGGFFDILSGKTKRAPNWMQDRGMEWFYRFAQEPKRMWNRYMIGNVKFIRLVLKEKWRKSNIK